MALQIVSAGQITLMTPSSKGFDWEPRLGEVRHRHADVSAEPVKPLKVICIRFTKENCCIDHLPSQSPIVM
jgi:hypothetical protein